MRRLFIDTSSDYLSILLSNDNTLLSYIKIFAGRQISEIALYHIDTLLNSNHLSINEIDEFYSIIGPGSFTGVRIGVSLILGLASGLSKNAYGITSLDTTAITSGRDIITVVSKLKDTSYAKRSYDFKNNIFSDISVVEYADFADEDFISVNSSSSDNIRLYKLIEDDRYIAFRSHCEPIYLRKPEAELNFDKISNAH